MKPHLHRIPLFLLCVAFASAEPPDIDQSLEFVTPPTGAMFIRWHGKPGRTYFIQTSDPADHLKTWRFEPIIETGTDIEISHEVWATAEKGFFRLKYSDTPTTDPDGDDFDYDGLTNWDEVSVHGTDPMEWDTDGDGLSDFWEIENGLDPNDEGSIDPANGANGDPDGDGLTNEFEYWYGGNPHLTDTDSDGLNDYDEVFVHSTSPANSDSDGDSLSDFSEIHTHGTNPTLWDTDEDTLSDGDEILVHFTNPIEVDTDGDWMWDDYEIDNNLNPTNAADGLLDADGDTLANQLEFVFLDKGFDPFVVNNAAAFPWAGDPDWDGILTQVEFVTHLTNPRQPDTDSDGMNDAWELAHGFNPKLNNLLAGPANQNPNADPDGDGLTNAEEEQLGTNPNNVDTDGDGVNDGVEDFQGSNPNDPNDNQPPPNGTVPATFTFGDHSGSHSEKYRVQLTPLEGDAGGVRYRTNRHYGQTQEGTFRLPKGAKYKIELIHIGTNPRYRGTPRPDFDYTLDANETTNCLVVDDPDDIMGVNWDSDPFYADGKDATLYVPLFEWVTPKGSPVSAADDIGDGKNEFVYDSSATAEMLLNLGILVKPTGTAGLTGHDGVKFVDRCTFDLPEIAGSTLAWDTDNDNGKVKVDGEHFIARATYTTLPAQISSFGLKQAKFTCDDDQESIADGDFEVFFTKDATNHPGGQTGSPNWFHFWKQFLPMGRIGTLTYDNGIGLAYGSTAAIPRTTKVFQRASETNDETGHEGLHAFYETLVHESYHITLWEGWWGIEGMSDVPAGSDTDGDTYPNLFETSAIGIIYGFDENDVNDLFDPNGDSAGTQYEEDECREQEHLIPDVTVYDSQDWSFDLTIKGKNQ